MSTFVAESLAFAIPTHKRPKLLVEALQSVLDEFGIDNFPFVVVAENDAVGSEGLAAANAWSALNGIQHRVVVVVVPDKGLSYCRNAALDAAFSHSQVLYVAMFDDDAHLEPGWFLAMQTAANSISADLYGGPTKYVLPMTVDPSLRFAPVFGFPYSESGQVPKLSSSNNFVLTRTVYEHFRPHVFDLRFNRSGGEDSHFFERARLAGMTTVWVSGARVEELVPANRANAEWVLDRHKLSAVNAARVAIFTRGWKGLVLQLLLVLKEFGSSLFWLLFWRGNSREVSRYRFWGAIGRLRGVFGFVQLHR